MVVEKSRRTLYELITALEILLLVNSFTHSRPTLTFSSLYIKALGGDLVDSSVVRELMSSIRTLPSNQMLDLLIGLRQYPQFAPTEIEPVIELLSRKAAQSTQPLHSSHSTGDGAFRTTVKDQKVILDKASRVLDPQTAEYTRIVDRVNLMFTSYMAKALISPKDICFYEILIFDARAAIRDAVGSAPRASLERALSRPHDYLACSCCDVMEGQLGANQPATALIYQLYLESGATINIEDWWMAFRAVLGTDESDETNALYVALIPVLSNMLMLVRSLFHRALAELRYLGMLRNNKRKADHLAKVRWKGL